MNDTIIIIGSVLFLIFIIFFASGDNTKGTNNIDIPLENDNKFVSSIYMEDCFYWIMVFIDIYTRDSLFREFNDKNYLIMETETEEEIVKREHILNKYGLEYDYKKFIGLFIKSYANNEKQHPYTVIMYSINKKYFQLNENEKFIIEREISLIDRSEMKNQLLNIIKKQYPDIK
jgi:hypothetical protein